VFRFTVFREGEIWLPGVRQTFADGALDEPTINSNHTLYAMVSCVLGLQVPLQAIGVEEMAALGQCPSSKSRALTND